LHLNAKGARCEPPAGKRQSFFLSINVVLPQIRMLNAPLCPWQFTFHAVTASACAEPLEPQGPQGLQQLVNSLRALAGLHLRNLPALHADALAPRSGASPLARAPGAPGELDGWGHSPLPSRNNRTRAWALLVCTTAVANACNKYKYIYIYI
jgi:hypothetical protein